MLPFDPPFYVISDTHWFHQNIVGFCGRHPQIAALIGPDTAKRIDHNSYMVERWNAVVDSGDSVLHLGDLCLWRGDGMKRMEYDIAPRLNGKKYIILGNHDKGAPSDYERMGFTLLEPFTSTYKGKKISFSHYPWKPKEWHQNEIHVHGHIHNNGYPKTANWADGTEPTQPNQVNVSVEVVDYTPQRIDKLLMDYVR